MHQPPHNRIKNGSLRLTRRFAANATSRLTRTACATWLALMKVAKSRGDGLCGKRTSAVQSLPKRKTNVQAIPSNRAGITTRRGEWCLRIQLLDGKHYSCQAVIFRWCFVNGRSECARAQEETSGMQKRCMVCSLLEQRTRYLIGRLRVSESRAVAAHDGCASANAGTESATQRLLSPGEFDHRSAAIPYQYTRQCWSRTVVQLGRRRYIGLRPCRIAVAVTRQTGESRYGAYMRVDRL